MGWRGIDDFLGNNQHFFYSRTFNGVAHNLIVIEITMRRGRSDAMKRELYKKIADSAYDFPMSCACPPTLFVTTALAAQFGKSSL